VLGTFADIERKAHEGRPIQVRCSSCGNYAGTYRPSSYILDYLRKDGWGIPLIAGGLVLCPKCLSGSSGCSLNPTITWEEVIRRPKRKARVYDGSLLPEIIPTSREREYTLMMTSTVVDEEEVICEPYRAHCAICGKMISDVRMMRDSGWLMRHETSSERDVYYCETCASTWGILL